MIRGNHGTIYRGVSICSPDDMFSKRAAREISKRNAEYLKNHIGNIDSTMILGRLDSESLTSRVQTILDTTNLNLFVNPNLRYYAKASFVGNRSCGGIPMSDYESRIWDESGNLSRDYNFGNGMVAYFGRINTGSRTKLSGFELTSIINANSKKSRLYRIDGGASVVSKVYNILSEKGIHHIFIYSKPTGDNCVGVVVMDADDGFSIPFLPTPTDSSIELDECYVNPPVSSMSDHISRTKRGELIIYRNESGKLMSSGFLH
jgi:hypothetical protein